MALSFPKDGIERLHRPIDGLWEDPDNLRVHSTASTEAIAASLRNFKQQKPIVVMPDGKVKAGNGTFRAAKMLGWETIAAVTWHGTEEAADAFAIIDNRSAELSSWDDVLLAAAMVALSHEDAELTSELGFTAREIANMQQALEGDTDAEREAAAPTLSAVIDFRSEEEQAMWFGFLRYLKHNFENEETHAARICAYIGSL